LTVYGRKGVSNLNAKTNPAAVAVIRLLGQRKDWTIRRLAAEFELSTSCVQHILNGKTWPDVNQAKELAGVRFLAGLLESIPTTVGTQGRSAAEDRVTHSTIVETNHLNTDASHSGVQVGTDLDVYTTQAYTRPSRKVYTQAQVLAELGLDSVEDMTQEMFDTLLPEQQRVVA